MSILEMQTLVVFREIRKDPLVQDLEQVLVEGDTERYFRMVERLLTGGEKVMGLKEYLARLLVTTETSFTMACERKEPFPFDQCVYDELAILGRLADMSASELGKMAGTQRTYRQIVDHPVNEAYAPIADNLTAQKDPVELARAIRDYVERYGCGIWSQASAFSFDGCIRPIHRKQDYSLDLMIGNESQLTALRLNTEAFLSGEIALNALLHGDRGTGKSSTVRGILNAYEDQGLKMIEVSKPHWEKIDSLMDQLRPRGCRFIIFIDDLSFEDYESAYKSLKAVIEGELEGKPDHVLIYATSNRRHLIRETWTDRMGDADDVHPEDSVQEKLSLSDRFGLVIRYGTLNRDEYYDMTMIMARRMGLDMPEEELRTRAKYWQLAGHGMSGRSVEQLIISIMTENVAGKKNPQ